MRAHAKFTQRQDLVRAAISVDPSSSMWTCDNSVASPCSGPRLAARIASSLPPSRGIWIRWRLVGVLTLSRIKRGASNG